MVRLFIVGVVLVVSSFSFGEGIPSASVTQEQQVTPSIDLFFPPPEILTSHPRILFKGDAFGIRHMTINGQDIEIDKNHRFFQRMPILQDELKTEFHLEAEGLDGQIITMNRVVQRIDWQYEADRLESGIDTIMTAYRPLAWERMELRDSLAEYLSYAVGFEMDRTTYPGFSKDENYPKQLHTMFQHAFLLRKGYSVILAVPWMSTYPDLVGLSSVFIDVVEPVSILPLTSFTLLWFNRDLSIFEMYGVRKEDGYKLHTWLLNDREIQPDELESNLAQEYDDFKRGRIVTKDVALWLGYTIDEVSASENVQVEHL